MQMVDHASGTEGAEGPDVGVLLLAGGTVCDPVQRWSGVADIAVRAGRIAAIGTGIRACYPAAAMLDCGGAVVVPGLINAHTHSTEALGAGFCDGMRLEEWLPALWSVLDRLSPEALRLSLLAGARAMIRGGCVGAVDHFRQTPMTLGAVEIALDTYRSAGFQVLLALMARDRVGSDGSLVGAPTGGPALGAGEHAALWRGAMARAEPPAGLMVGPGPSGPVRCSDRLLEAADGLSAEFGMPWHLHLSETADERRVADLLYGRPAAVHLARLGLLSPRVSLAHGVWLDADEIALIAEAGATVIHNPVSNMALGSGIAPVARLRAAGASIGIGTDGAASNGGQDLLESVKMAAFLGRLDTSDPSRWLSAQDALAMVIAGGRRALGLPGDGRLVVGAPADIAVFDQGSKRLDGFADWARTLVYDRRRGARHVLARGRVLLEGGVLRTIDEAALDAGLEAIAQGGP
ncbi:MAG: amidohydrolase [Rhodospirillales bacterium]|nr:amidohydrolase [Rhodospirillales bacterium]